jgi:acyl-CoA synthetase (AMP-forming)/AMP-acid ligase II
VATPSRLGDLLDAGDPSDAAVIGDHGTTTWGELRTLVADVEVELERAGVRPGTAVAVARPNTADAVAAWFAVWRRDAVVVPLNPRLTVDERDHVLASTRPAARLDADGATPLDDPTNYDLGVALVSFTSGTTGRPKPVPLRHDRVLTLMDGVLATIRGGAGAAPTRGAGARPPMPNLIPVSLSLWAGIYNVLFAFLVGAPVVLMTTFDTRRFADLVAEHGIRSTVLPPAAMVMLADDEGVTDLAPLRLVRSISAPLSPLQARRFRDRFGVTVLNGYGQTELGGEVVGWSAADGREFGDTKLGAVGRPHPGIDVRVVDDAGHEVDPDEIGALEVRATARVPAGVDLADRLTADGFLRTGDLGRVDADGFVWIEGRESDMVNRGGLKVFPAEVEEVLRLDPAIVDAVVVGEPDDRLGEVPAAYVVVAEGASLDVAGLEDRCRAHLAPYKLPVRFTAVPEIPRNEIGKVQRHLLT